MTDDALSVPLGARLCDLLLSLFVTFLCFIASFFELDHLWPLVPASVAYLRRSRRPLTCGAPWCDLFVFWGALLRVAAYL